MRITIILVSALIILGVSANDFKELFLQNILENQIFDQAKCNACKKTFEKFESMTFSEFQAFAIKTFNSICPKVQEKTVCLGISETYVDEFIEHFYKHALDPQTLCAKMDVCEDPYTILTVDAYAKEIFGDKPSEDAKKEWVSQATKRTQSKDYTIVQLADLHIDLEYAENYDAFCSEPFCCREENGLPKDAKNGAQHWGSYANCDLPWRTIDNMLDKIFNDVKPDVIVWTGDSVSHDVWHQTEQNQTLPTRVITERIIQKLNVPLYPIYGNHESYPCDQMDVNGQNSQWLKDQVYDMWKPILEEQALQSLKSQGYYAQYNEKLNVRFIALNTQTCDSLNFYLLDDVTDPSHQLKWLREQLLEAERNFQFVHLFGHIPPGDFFCQTQWATRYSILMERFQHVVKGQFYGHTHQDQVEVTRSYANKQPVSTIYIAPSGTTYSFQNPSFRAYNINGANNEVVNYQQYRLDLGKANRDGPSAVLEWNVAYSFLEEYGLKDSTPVSVFSLAAKFEKDEKLLRKYIANFYSGSEKLTKDQFSQLDSLIYKSATKKFYTCGIQSSTFDDFYDCNDGLEMIKRTGFVTFRTLETLYGHWRVPKN